MNTKEYHDLFGAFEEATTISLTLVALPVIFLLVGLFLDKTFSTTPLFIFIGIIVGVGAGIYRAVKISEQHKKIKTKEKNV